MSGTAARKKAYQEIRDRLEAKGWTACDLVIKFSEDDLDANTDQLWEDKRTWWDKLTQPLWRAWHKVRGTVFNSYWYKRGWYRIRHGFDPADTWSLDYSFARWAVPRLKYLRDNIHGHPMDVYEDKKWEHTEEEIDEAHDKWVAYLDEMIWAFEFYLDDDAEYAGKEQWDRWEVGMDLFRQYYRNLWD